MSEPDPVTAQSNLYRKRPVVIEARQWTGANAVDLLDWIGGGDSYKDGQVLMIFTLEGWHEASLGDWIIKGVKGEFYPCKPDIFAATYEPSQHSSPTMSEPTVSAARLRQHAMAIRGRIGRASAKRDPALYEEAADLIDALVEALGPFAAMRADDGDTFDKYPDMVLVRCECSVREIKSARAILARVKGESNG